MKVICPYCDKPARLVSGMQVYPQRSDLWHRKFYVCNPCDARVGCHNHTVKPYGRLANAELREARGLAHDLFDPLWRNANITRNDGYAWMAEAMGLPSHQAHIGMFDLSQCRQLIQIIEQSSGNPIQDWYEQRLTEEERCAARAQAQKALNDSWISKIKERLFSDVTDVGSNR